MLGAAVVCAVGCGGPSEGQLVNRAAFDLGCPEAEIRVTRLDDRTRGVQGCGQRKTYVWHCAEERGAVRRGCSWIDNTSGGSY